MKVSVSLVNLGFQQLVFCVVLSMSQYSFIIHLYFRAVHFTSHSFQKHKPIEGQIKTWEDVESEGKKKRKRPLRDQAEHVNYTHVCACVCQTSDCLRMLFGTPPPFILGERGNEKEVMASEQEVCASHSATAVVFCCCHSLFGSDCLLKPSCLLTVTCLQQRLFSSIKLMRQVNKQCEHGIELQLMQKKKEKRSEVILS